jgi:hypothetical protein
VRVFGFFQGVGKRVIRLARDGAEGACNRVKATMVIINRSTSTTVEKGGTGMVFSRFISDTSLGAPLSHGRWSMRLMIARVKFMMNVNVRLVILLRQRRTDYTGPSD